MVKDYLNIKKKDEKTRFKSKRANKKSHGCKWSDSDSSGSKSKDKEIANLCLMATESSEENDE